MHPIMQVMHCQASPTLPPLLADVHLEGTATASGLCASGLALGMSPCFSPPSNQLSPTPSPGGPVGGAMSLGKACPETFTVQDANARLEGFKVCTGSSALDALRLLGQCRVQCFH